MENFISKNNISNDVKKLSGGLSNEIFLIDNKYIWKNIKNSYLFDHANEIEVLKKINFSRFPVKLFDYNILSNPKYICYSFLKGKNISLDYYKENIDQIIKLSKEYNKCQVDVPNFWVEIIPKWIKLLPNNLFEKSDIKIDKIYQELNNLMNIFEKDILVLCHHDIHSGNIISNDNKLYLIDLEFSFNNYIYVELGNIICEYYTDYSKEQYNYHDINSKIKVKVLKDYDIEVNELNLKKLDVGINVSHFYWMIWGFIVNSQNHLPESFDYYKFAISRYNILNSYFNIK